VSVDSQRAVEPAEAQAWKRHVLARDARLHVAAIRGISARRALDLGLARQTGLPRNAGGRRRIPATPDLWVQVERCVPERVPFFLADDLRRQLDAELAQRLHLLIAHPAETGDDAEFGSYVRRERAPRAAAHADPQLAD